MNLVNILVKLHFCKAHSNTVLPSTTTYYLRFLLKVDLLAFLKRSLSGYMPCPSQCLVNGTHYECNVECGIVGLTEWNTISCIVTFQHSDSRQILTASQSAGLKYVSSLVIRFIRGLREVVNFTIKNLLYPLIMKCHLVQIRRGDLIGHQVLKRAPNQLIN